MGHASEPTPLYLLVANYQFPTINSAVVYDFTHFTFPHIHSIDGITVAIYLSYCVSSNLTIVSADWFSVNLCYIAIHSKSIRMFQLIVA